MHCVGCAGRVWLLRSLGRFDRSEINVLGGEVGRDPNPVESLSTVMIRATEHAHELNSQILCPAVRLGNTAEANTCTDVDSNCMSTCELPLSNIVAIVDHFGAGRCFACLCALNTTSTRNSFLQGWTSKTKTIIILNEEIEQMQS
jgi:hypothetical protein